MQEVIFIIFVGNQIKSRDFYKKVFQNEPVLDVEGMTEFKINSHTRLGIMPKSGIDKITGSSYPVSTSNKYTAHCELYIYVDNPEEYYKRAIQVGADAISSLKLMNWGDEVAYCADFDGNIIAFAKKSII